MIYPKLYISSSDTSKDNKVLKSNINLYEYGGENFDTISFKSFTQFKIWPVKIATPIFSIEYDDEHNIIETTGEKCEDVNRLYSLTNNIDISNTTYSQYIDTNVNYATLKIYNDNTAIKLCVEFQSTPIVKVYYTVTRDSGNILEEYQKHYLDKIYNKNLPNLSELLSAIVNSTDFDSRELLKKMLLDYEKMFQNNGTKKSVENFFKFLGYEDYTDKRFVIEDILKKENNTSYKTGLYSAEYSIDDTIENEQEYDKNNLPNTEIDVTDITEFTKRAGNAIVLANKYFTTEEQLINYFTIVYSTNIPYFQYFNQRNYILSYFDTQYFRHNISINVSEYVTPDHQNISINYLVKNNKQIQEDIKSVFTRYKCNTSNISNSTYPYYMNVLSEMTMTDINTYYNELNSYMLEHGTILDSIYENIIIDGSISRCIHLNISIPTYTEQNRILRYVSYKFYKVDDDRDTSIERNILYEKTQYTGIIDDIIMLSKFGKYRLIVDIYDDYGAKDEWYYDFNLIDSDVIIDVDVFNSLPGTNSDMININTDSNGLISLTSTDLMNGLTNEPIENNILNENNSSNTTALSYTPVERINYSQTLLNTYYNNVSISDISNYLDHNLHSKPVLELTNHFITLSESTETIPIGLIDPYIHVVTFDYSTDTYSYCTGSTRNIASQIKIYFKNPTNNVYELNDGSTFHSIDFDYYATLIPINSDNGIYMFKDSNNITYSVNISMMIISTKPGQDIQTRDLYIYDDSTSKYVNITETINFKEIKLPLTYNIILWNDLTNKIVDYDMDSEKCQLFSTNMELQTIDETAHPIYKTSMNIGGVIKNRCMIVSLYPILHKYQDITDYELKKNDVIFIKINPEYVNKPYDVTFEIRDTFSPFELIKSNISETIATTKNISYRCIRNGIFDLVVKFGISDINGYKTYETIYQSLFCVK